jgi:hypothetical protein
LEQQATTSANPQSAIISRQSKPKVIVEVFRATGAERPAPLTGYQPSLANSVRGAIANRREPEHAAKTS